MMAPGSSEPWPDILERMTGSRDISAQPMIDYFQPLLDWLAQENEGHDVGWDRTVCPNVPDLE